MQLSRRQILQAAGSALRKLDESPEMQREALLLSMKLSSGPYSFATA